MRKSLAAFATFNLVLGAIVTFAGPGAAADTHVIKATGALTWTSDGKSSKTDGTPLVLDNLKVGDIVEFQVPAGIPHGVITIKQLANVQPPENNEIKDPVWICGQAENKTAVLREIQCGAQPKFGANSFTGSMKLEVLSTFKADVLFWCKVHHFKMTGTLKLKP